MLKQDTDGEVMRREWLTVSDVARKANMSTRTVYKWLKSGELKANRAMGGRGHYRISYASWEEFKSKTLISEVNGDVN